jgi:hypothetical protein
MKNLVVFALFCISISNSIGQSKINGIGFVSTQNKISAENVTPLIEVNANAVAINPFAFVRAIDNPKITFKSNHSWYGETKDGIKQYASEFKKQGLKIMLKPQVWVMNGTYTGLIKMNSEEDWKTFESDYRDFILYHAQIANDIEADLLCVGVELEQFTVNRPDYWKGLIKEIRTIYKGKLTYAANWDEYKRIKFWHKLDFIGIDAYFPLSDLKTPSVKNLEQGWIKYKNEIIGIQKKYARPILFTEYGYRNKDFGAKEPWDSGHNDKSVNHEVQCNALQAIHNQFWNEKWFAGGFLWKWFPKHKSAGGENENRFTPQNKPAEKLLKKLYSK